MRSKARLRRLEQRRGQAMPRATAWDLFAAETDEEAARIGAALEARRPGGAAEFSAWLDREVLAGMADK